MFEDELEVVKGQQDDEGWGICPFIEFLSRTEPNPQKDQLDKYYQIFSSHVLLTAIESTK